MYRYLLLLLLWAGPAIAAQKLASEGGSFTPTADMVVRYCASENVQCSQARTIKTGVRTQCDNSTWGDLAPGVVKGCWGDPVAPAPPVAAPAPFVACDIDISHKLPLDIVARAKWHQPIPASVESDNTDWAAWPCEDGSVQVQLYTREQFNELTSFIGTAAMKAAFGNPTWLTMINDWIAAQPVGRVTQKEYDFVVAKEAEHAASLTPAQQFKVAPLSGQTSRPVVRLTAAGNTATVTGVRVAFGTPCDSTKMAGNYMSVQGQPDTTGKPLGDVYAICQ